MAYKEYIAHIRKKDGKKQTVFVHLKETAELAAEFADSFGARELGYQCGLYHDIGKYSDLFQGYIRGENNYHIDHSSAGAQVLCKMKSLGCLQAFCIAGHHAGLPNLGVSSDLKTEATLYGRLKKDVEDYSYYKGEVPPPKNTLSISTMVSKYPFSAMFFARMVFSCLIDADYLNTEKFIEDGKVDRTGYDSIRDIADRVFKKLEEKGFTNPEGKKEINQKRAFILNSCLKAGLGPCGMYTLTVPTGGGKTLSSTAFALKQCVANNLRRIIYVIPYTSIIEQTADTLRDYVNLKYKGSIDNVLEHHSAVNYDDDSDSSKLAKLATENWDAPLIVTTNVQFFESLFANRTSKCRKLHNIVNSLIIFDEAQMFPAEYMVPILSSLAELTNAYGCSCLLASATQPPWQELFSKYSKIWPVECREIMTGIPEMYSFFRRTNYVSLGSCCVNDIAEHIKKNNQVLCIAKTKKTADMIYQKLKGEKGVIYLSTNLYPAHRRRVIKQIRRRLNSEEKPPCRVISTSVISVGVDLDFPVGYVEMTALDAILQAAGRVNREGDNSWYDSKVYVFSLKDQFSSFRMQEIEATKKVQSEIQDIFTPEAVNKYFSFLFAVKGNGINALDDKGIMGTPVKHYAFKDIAQMFKLIEEDTVSVLVPRQRKARCISGLLCNGERNRDIMRKAAAYIVNVRRSDFEKLNKDNNLEVLDNELAILRKLSLYDKVQGLIMPTS
ncbi:CRISPR-associated helicase/endonuclease Cas3 [Selenomonas sp. KH1T6]|uniref:CRISPR-associated helicase/endonuclease Cas3 n=1 Tax=Selenomonas sp. KH1T6 TaxID=3158784 RepID=UPI0008A7360D|nr:CRISPR-associated endonuclease/helicase Cas3 [Selenomonas ruminantium]